MSERIHNVPVDRSALSHNLRRRSTPESALWSLPKMTETQPLVVFSRRILAELLGSLLLAATVVGSGIMAERLAGGNVAVALLANTGATVAVLATLIALLGPLSGAHFNPAVSLVQALRGKLPWSELIAYSLVQIAGCCAGALLAHVMFELPVMQSSLHVRTGAAQWLAESIATLGLVLVILGHRRSEDAPWMVAAWIGAAYWFTASTSFANPAITIARSLSDTFSGIRPVDVPGFVVAQIVGALVALWLARILFIHSDSSVQKKALSAVPETREASPARSKAVG
jgi:glycerol uptake facilitator-like aquaporin